MQRRTKVIIILSTIFVLALTIGGYTWMKHEEKEAFIVNQEKRITKYYKYNVPSFKSITFTGYQKIPTGSIIFGGYINNDKKLKFAADVSLASGETNFDGSGGETGELSKLMRKNIKTVSQIEKIEKEQKEKTQK